MRQPSSINSGYSTGDAVDIGDAVVGVTHFRQFCVLFNTIGEIVMFQELCKDHSGSCNLKEVSFSVLKTRATSMPSEQLL